VLARRVGRFAGCGKPADIDPRITDVDPLGRDSFKQKRRASALRRGQKQIRLRKRLLAVGTGPAVSEGRKQRKRLPNRQDQLEAVRPLSPSRVSGVPVAQFFGVNDVGGRERGVRAEVAVPRQAHCCEVSEPSARQQIAQRASGLPLDGEIAEVVRVTGRQKHRDAEPVRQLLPHTQVPRSGIVAAQ
jgi:hypothetical protein